MNIRESKTLLKDNKIKFYTNWDKKRLTGTLANEHNLLPKTELEKEKSNDVKYDRLKTIKKNPREVMLVDIETGEIKTFPSIYKAAKFIDQCPQTNSNWGKKEEAWNNKYRVVSNNFIMMFMLKNIIKLIFNLRFFYIIKNMSWFNRIRSTASSLASNVLSGARQLALNIIPESVQRRATDFGNWLTDRVGPEQTPQVLDEIVEHVRTNYPPRQSFEVRDSESALRNFARVHTINGIGGYDARSFLQNTRQNITSVLRNNRGTKVKLIFKCNMERPGNLGETVIKPTDFHSNTEVNLD